MMRNISIALLLAMMPSLYSCGDKNLTPNGFKIKEYTKSSGQKPAPGDMALVHIYAYADGQLIESTRQNDRVMPVKVYTKDELLKMKETGKPNPVYEAIYMMSVGDSISIDIPITDDIKRNPKTANAKEMHYDIVMINSKTAQSLQEEKDKQLNLIAEIATEVKDLASQYTTGALEGKLTTTQSGLKYMLLKEGTGPAPEMQKPVKVNYYGALTTGERFDDSFSRGEPIMFTLGGNQVIKGWEEGIALLKGGDTAVMFIPPDLGYGKAGSRGIPPDSELIFYIEVL